MRLVSKADAEKLKADPKAEVRTFYVEKAKGNTIPKHFFAEDNKDRKTLTINGAQIEVARNKERSEYTAFATGEGDAKQSFYVRDHAFLDHATEYVTYEKPKPEPKPKKEKAAKADGAADAPEGTNFKGAKGKSKGKAATAEAGGEAEASDTGGA